MSELTPEQLKELGEVCDKWLFAQDGSKISDHVAKHYLAKIDALTAERDAALHEQNVERMNATAAKIERDAALAQLKAAREQKPAFWANKEQMQVNTEFEVSETRDAYRTVPLYAALVPAAKEPT